MASYQHGSNGHAAYGTPANSNGGPTGIFAPGTKVQVGGHRVIIERYLSEGGFAHVYVVKIPTANGTGDIAVLKRVAVPDKEALANMRTEVETMKKLRGHKHIVTYIDSHASQLKGGGYEVFLLMEYCEGGGLIDFMNTRLKNRLTEPEILKIFSDTAEGVACMHYLKPPLLHRDLKVENVLISDAGSTKTYKLCDFGSTAPPRPAATSVTEGRLIEDDVQRHTTLQYRSPEMVDVYRKRPIDEKSDIWALGVLLYKLCYYITPFEEKGQMAILKASFRFPGQPVFSDRLKKLIAFMLMEDPKNRPTIYGVLAEVCAMRGRQVPIKDIYANRTHSEVRNNQRWPSPEPNVKSPPVVGISQAPLEKARPSIPDITPMRRGRPITEAKSNDPFAALDSTSYETRSAAIDELAKRYPTAEEFGLLQDRKDRFEFGRGNERDLTKRVTEALADEAFAGAVKPRAALDGTSLNRAASLKQPTQPSVKTASPAPPPIVTAHPKMVSTGTTMTSPLPPPPTKQANLDPTRPIWRVPVLETRSGERTRPTSLFVERESQSSRPSFESLRPPPERLRSIHRSKSAEEQLSPTKSGRGLPIEKTRSHGEEVVAAAHSFEDSPSSVDFLREREREESRGHQRTASTLRRLKHASMPAGAAPKHSLAGKFGSVLKRFEDGVSHALHVKDHEHQHEKPTEPDYSLQPVESAIDETEDLSPEMRRELERRRLSMEEKRVADAAAAYKSGVGSGTRGGPNKASQIQDRVKTLLDESGRSSPVKKTASGYGHYTDTQPPPLAIRTAPQRQPDSQAFQPIKHAQTMPTASLPSRAAAVSRPQAPRKPEALRTGSNSPLPMAQAAKPPHQRDWEADFSQRYPNVSLDMVETEIQTVNRTGQRELRIKDV